MNNVLITGGAGFVGSHLVEYLLSLGKKITIIDDLSTGTISNLEDAIGNLDQITLYVDKVQDSDLLEELIRKCDCVYHLASSVGVELIMNDPVGTVHNIFDSTALVMKYASRYRKKVLITSTSEVYGKSKDYPFEEDGDRLEGATTVHRWAYANAKALDEFLGLAYFKKQKLPVSIVRLFNTVGPRQSADYGMVIPKMVRAALRNQRINVYGTGQQTRCFCHVKEVVVALNKIMESRDTDGEVINVGSNEETSILTLAKIIKEITSSLSEIHTMPYEIAFPGGGFEDMQRRIPSIAKVKNLTGWSPNISLLEIVKDVCYREKKMLN